MSHVSIYMFKKFSMEVIAWTCLTLCIKINMCGFAHWKLSVGTDTLDSTLPEIPSPHSLPCVPCELATDPQSLLKMCPLKESFTSLLTSLDRFKPFLLFTLWSYPSGTVAGKHWEYCLYISAPSSDHIRLFQQQVLPLTYFNYDPTEKLHSCGCGDKLQGH